MRRSRFSLIKPFSLRENTNFSGRNILQKHRNPGSCKYYYMDGSDSPNLPFKTMIIHPKFMTLDNIVQNSKFYLFYCLYNCLFL